MKKEHLTLTPVKLAVGSETICARVWWWTVTAITTVTLAGLLAVFGLKFQAQETIVMTTVSGQTLVLFSSIPVSFFSAGSKSPAFPSSHIL